MVVYGDGDHLLTRVLPECWPCMDTRPSPAPSLPTTARLNDNLISVRVGNQGRLAHRTHCFLLGQTGDIRAATCMLQHYHITRAVMCRQRAQSAAYCAQIMLTADSHAYASSQIEVLFITFIAAWRESALNH